MVVSLLICPIDTPESLVYTEGILSTNSIVSHLVGCRPYSKSVSIKFWGFETLILWTGSNIDSPGSILFSCSSTKIWISSLSLIEVVLYSNVIVVSLLSASYDVVPPVLASAKL